MEFPPTPPDEKSHPRTLSTPINNNAVTRASTSLTPEQTPPSMLAIPQPPLLSHHPSSAADSFRTAREDFVASPSPFSDQARRSKSPFVPADLDLDEHVSYIPVQELALHAPDNTDLIAPARTTEDGHNTLSNVQLHPSQSRRKKAKRQSLRSAKPTADHNSTAQSTSTENWNDLPADMIATNRVYNHIRHSKMERLEAVQDGTAIEAYIIETDDPRKHALRHVKKRHSLRSENGHRLPETFTSQTVEGASRRTTQGEKSAGIKNEHSLRRAKAFEPRNAAPAMTTDTLSTISHTRTLRHERRPLSADGRASLAKSSDLPRSPALHGVGLARSEPADEHRKSVDLPLSRSITETGLREVRLADIPPPSLPVAGYSPSIKSHRFANTQTPLSGMSDRTEMELCEAKNVAFFPHSNESVLLVDSGNLPAKKTISMDDQLAPRTFRPLSFTFEDPESTLTSSSTSSRRDLSTPEIQLNGHVHGVDSPLTNPRAPPLPPAIKFIPATPSVDDDRQVAPPTTESPTKPVPQRRGSLMRTARRLSDTIIQPLFPRSAGLDRTQSLRTTNVTAPGTDRLHPMWQPNYIWDDNDDDYDDEDEDQYYEDYEPLPPGGDTSAHPAEQPRGLFPRQMSVRMPGFRGTGGFLVGNSLGVERHGTNKRRHHVSLPASKRSSKARFQLFQSMRSRMTQFKEAREDAAREKRRAQLKDQIGLRVVHHV